MEAHGFHSLHFVHSLLAHQSWSEIDAANFICDAPIPLLYKECDRRYPNSKFILTTRSKKSWLSSMRSHLKHGRFIWQWDSATNKYHQDVYGTQTFEEALLASRFDAFHADVASYFQDRPADLLVVDLESGFDVERLCSFIGVDAVLAEAPRKNERRRSTLFERIRYYLNPRN